MTTLLFTLAGITTAAHALEPGLDAIELVAAPDAAAETTRVLTYQIEGGGTVSALPTDARGLEPLATEAYSAGWSHIRTVDVSGQDAFQDQLTVWYNQTTGLAVITDWTDDGRIIGRYANQWDAWDLIEPYNRGDNGEGRMIWYNQDTGLLLIGRVEANDVFTLSSSYISAGWTHIRPYTDAGETLALFYRESDGLAVITTLDDTGIGGDRYANSIGGWDHIEMFIQDNQPRALIYQSATGAAGVVEFADRGANIDTLWGTTFTSGWTHIELYEEAVQGCPTEADTRALFYRASDGLQLVSRIPSGAAGDVVLYSPYMSEADMDAASTLGLPECAASVCEAMASDRAPVDPDEGQTLCFPEVVVTDAAIMQIDLLEGSLAQEYASYVNYSLPLDNGYSLDVDGGVATAGFDDVNYGFWCGGQNHGGDSDDTLDAVDACCELHDGLAWTDGSGQDPDNQHGFVTCLEAAKTSGVSAQGVLAADTMIAQLRPVAMLSGNHYLAALESIIGPIEDYRAIIDDVSDVANDIAAVFAEYDTCDDIRGQNVIGWCEAVWPFEPAAMYGDANGPGFPNVCAGEWIWWSEDCP